MRTTIELDDDTAAEVQRLRRAEQRGVSEAVNDLIRRGMLRDDSPSAFSPTTWPLGIRIDVSNISDALDLLEGPESR